MALCGRTGRALARPGHGVGLTRRRGAGHAGMVASANASGRCSANLGRVAAITRGGSGDERDRVSRPSSGRALGQPAGPRPHHLRCSGRPAQNQTAPRPPTRRGPCAWWAVPWTSRIARRKKHRSSACWPKSRQRAKRQNLPRAPRMNSCGRLARIALPLERHPRLDVPAAIPAQD